MDRVIGKREKRKEKKIWELQICFLCLSRNPIPIPKPNPPNRIGTCEEGGSYIKQAEKINKT